MNQSEQSSGKKLNPAILIFLLLPLLGIVGALAINDPRRQTTSTLLPPVVGYTPERRVVDNPAPDFELKTLQGSSVKLSSLRGQWVFLNFWATWCPPCRQ